jgi:hypothetical protein
LRKKLTNFSNDKQTWKKLKSGFYETVFHETNGVQAQW